MFLVITERRQKIANLLNYRFSTLGKFRGPQFLLQISNACNSKPKNFWFHFATDKDCHDAIKALGRNKPIGPSHIPAWAIKDSRSVIVPHPSLVNYWIRMFCFPNELKQAHVSLYKKDGPEEPNNCRPIFITPCLSKIIETILTNQVCQYLHDKILLSKNHFGFRKKYSTIDYFALSSSKAKLTWAVLSQPLSFIFQKLLIQSIVKFWISSWTTKVLMKAQKNLIKNLTKLTKKLNLYNMLTILIFYRLVHPLKKARLS